MLIIFNQSDLYFDMNFRDAIVRCSGYRREEKEGQQIKQEAEGKAISPQPFISQIEDDDDETELF